MPIVFIALYTLIVARGMGLNLTLVFFTGLILFSIPHIFWTIALKYAKPGKFIDHAGYLGASLALIIIACLPPDSSGFLNQWLAYWRLAGLLIIISTGLAFLLQLRFAK